MPGQQQGQQGQEQQQQGQQAEARPNFQNNLQAALEKAGATREQVQQARSEALAKEARERAGVELEEDDQEDEQKPGDDGQQSEEGAARARTPRYDADSFRAWIDNNPEKAARLFKDVGATAATDDFIRLSKKGRRMREAIDSRTKKVEERESEIEKKEQALEASAEQTLKVVDPAIKLLEAIGNRDFAGFDLIFERMGMKFDDWIRGRAKQGVTTVSKEAENRRIKELEEENARLKKPAEEKPKEEKPAAESQKEKEPGITVDDLEDELEGDHPVRDLANWQQKVQKVMAEHYDEEEDTHSITVEVAADRVLEEYEERRRGKKEAKGKKPEEESGSSKTEKKGKRKPSPPPAGEPDMSDFGTEPKDPLEAMQWRQARAMAKADRIRSGGK